MKVLLIAPPGAGKGTQGVVIASHFGVPHIASGDLLRDHVTRGTELGRTVQQFLDRGELVPDEIVLEMAVKRWRRRRAAGTSLTVCPARCRRRGRCMRSRWSWT